MDETRLRPTESVETALPSLADLPGLSRAELAGLWRQMFGRPVPKSISLALLLRFLAFEIQVRAHGGLPAGFGEALARRVGEAAGGKTVTARLRPGGRLLREWNGTTHVVDIVEGGFVWRGATHASLSAIAKEITGAHWSGPRFFGLTAPVEAGKPKRQRATDDVRPVGRIAHGDRGCRSSGSAVAGGPR